MNINVTISAVNMSKSFVTVSDDGPGAGDIAQLTSTTTINIRSVDAANNAINYTWQVITFA